MSYSRDTFFQTAKNRRNLKKKIKVATGECLGVGCFNYEMVLVFQSEMVFVDYLLKTQTSESNDWLIGTKILKFSYPLLIVSKGTTLIIYHLIQREIILNTTTKDGGSILQIFVKGNTIAGVQGSLINLWILNDLEELDKFSSESSSATSFDEILPNTAKSSIDLFLQQPKSMDLNQVGKSSSRRKLDKSGRSYRGSLNRNSSIKHIIIPTKNPVTQVLILSKMIICGDWNGLVTCYSKNGQQLYEINEVLTQNSILNDSKRTTSLVRFHNYLIVTTRDGGCGIWSLRDRYQRQPIFGLILKQDEYISQMSATKTQVSFLLRTTNNFVARLKWKPNLEKLNSKRNQRIIAQFVSIPKPNQIKKVFYNSGLLIVKKKNKDIMNSLKKYKN